MKRWIIVIVEYLEPVAWLVAAPNSEGYKRRAISIIEIPPALHHLRGKNC